MNKLLKKPLIYFDGFCFYYKYGYFAQKRTMCIVHLSKKATNDLTLFA